METKHTPGPWHVDDALIYPTVRAKNNDRFSIDVYLFKEHAGKIVSHHISEEAIANARLVAAAPELLKACNDMWEWIMKQDDWKGKDSKKDWKIAIDKAIGKEL